MIIITKTEELSKITFMVIQETTPRRKLKLAQFKREDHQLIKKESQLSVE